MKESAKNKITMEYLENLLYLFILVHPAASPEKIFNYWEKDKVLKEYQKPEKEIVVKIVTTVRMEIIANTRI